MVSEFWQARLNVHTHSHTITIIVAVAGNVPAVSRYFVVVRYWTNQSSSRARTNIRYSIYESQKQRFTTSTVLLP